MNQQTRLSAKGQIVIPKDVRDAHGWQPGTELEVIDRPDGILLRPTQPLSKRLTLADFNARIPAHSGPPLSLEDMDRAVVALAARPLPGA